MVTAKNDKATDRLKILTSSEVYDLSLKAYQALIVGCAALMGLFITALPSAQGKLSQAYGFGLEQAGKALSVTAGAIVVAYVIRVTARRLDPEASIWPAFGLLWMALTATVAALQISLAVGLIIRATE